MGMAAWSKLCCSLWQQILADVFMIFREASWKSLIHLDCWSSWCGSYKVWEWNGNQAMSSCHSLISCSDSWAEPCWTQLQASPAYNEESTMSTFQISHTAFALLPACETTARLVPAFCMPWYVEAIQKELVSSCVHPSVAPQASLQDGRVDTHLRGKRRIQSGNGWTWHDDCCWIYVIPHHYHSLPWAKNTKCSHTQHLNRRHRHERHGNNIYIETRSHSSIKVQPVLRGNWSYSCSSLYTIAYCHELTMTHT